MESKSTIANHHDEIGTKMCSIPSYTSDTRLCGPRNSRETFHRRKHKTTPHPKQANDETFVTPTGNSSTRGISCGTAFSTPFLFADVHIVHESIFPPV